MSETTTVSREQLAVGCYAYDFAVYGKNGYGYKPSFGAGIFFCACFGTFLVLHIIQTSWKRVWWTVVFAIGAFTELIGWAGRTWSSKCPYNSNAFLMQITTLIIAPTFITAGLYIILGRMIRIIGPHTSPIGPRMYLYIFSTCDVISLVVQAVGGAMASIASSAQPPEDTHPGTTIMVAGIVFQLASITIYAFLFILFIKRSRGDSLPRRFHFLLFATSFSTLMIYVRSIYRTIELAQGWTGYLITHEGYFIVLDGVMMILAIGVFNIIHPAWFGLDSTPTYSPVSISTTPAAYKSFASSNNEVSDPHEMQSLYQRGV